MAVADARAEAVFGPRGAHPRAEMAEAALGIQAAPAVTRESFRKACVCVCVCVYIYIYIKYISIFCIEGWIVYCIL